MVSVHIWQSLGQPKLDNGDLILKTYSGESCETLKIKGMATVQVKFN